MYIFVRKLKWFLVKVGARRHTNSILFQIIKYYESYRVIRPQSDTLVTSSGLTMIVANNGIASERLHGSRYATGATSCLRWLHTIGCCP
jgi:hypothetical protein